MATTKVFCSRLKWVRESVLIANRSKRAHQKVSIAASPPQASSLPKQPVLYRRDGRVERGDAARSARNIRLTQQLKPFAGKNGAGALRVVHMHHECRPAVRPGEERITEVHV